MNDRYLNLMKWAARRYTKDSKLEITIGGKPSAYSRIEAAAFNRYVIGA